MIEDLILLACTHLVMFWLGYKWGIHNAVIRIISNYMNNPGDMERAFKQLNDLREDEAAEEEIAVEARVEAGQVYIWRKDTQTFLGQGDSLDAAMQSVGLTHKGTYRISKETVDRVEAELPNRL
jgi:hypothetical protein